MCDMEGNGIYRDVDSSRWKLSPENAVKTTYKHKRPTKVAFPVDSARTSGSFLQVRREGSFLFLVVGQSGVLFVLMSGKRRRALKVLHPVRDK